MVSKPHHGDKKSPNPSASIADQMLKAARVASSLYADLQSVRPAS